MSNALLPTLIGRTWPFARAPRFSTTIKTAVSGREYRTQNWTYPKYEWKLVYEVLREFAGLTEQQQLMGFINARAGSYDSFLFNDPDDFGVSLQAIGTGDGTNKLFQLVRTRGGFLEPIFDLNGAPSIFVNGVLKASPADYSVSSSGLVTFVSAPPAGQIVTATFSYYWRVRFQKDGADFSQMLWKRWELKDLSFITAKS